ncbi:MAG TPA: hypothetical protein VK190_06930 [Pseudoneobacillus sp.]|nr:hypothetical protein [Pseudoneobacillus sp.]
MSEEDKELFFLIMEEAYQKGITSGDLSVESFIIEIRQKLIPVFLKEMPIQKEV